MHVSANGFPQLKVLQLFELSEMDKLNIEKGAMPWLMQLQSPFSTRVFGVDKLLNLVEVKLLVDSKKGVSSKAYKYSAFVLFSCCLYWDYSW